MNILLTGGAGFIGSHTAVELLNADHQVIILDNLCNASAKVLDRIESITNKKPVFYQGDIRDRALLDTIFTQHKIDSVIHFAGLKAVGESIEQPLKYYENNVSGTITLLQAMQNAGVFSLIFSSSATVYGHPPHVPITESMPVGATSNPYGTSKYIVERIVQDLHISDARWSVVLLRYFNPIGAHESGLIGENPSGIPNNLMPYICQVALGKLPKLSIFGNDYPTVDGTGVRDYIHVVDLALGHLEAVSVHSRQSGCFIYNLGTGEGYSVLQMVHAFERVNQIKIPYQIAPRRSGDIDICYADSTHAQQQLGWKAKRHLDQMMKDAWHWQCQNPNGYI